MGFKYESPKGARYGMPTLRKRYAKQYDEFGQDDIKFEQWLIHEKGFKRYYV